MAEFGSPELLCYTLEAAADLSNAQYHGVRWASQYRCNLGSNPGDRNLAGVLQNKPRLGEFATVACFGKTKMYAGGAITAGTMVSVNGSGRAAAVTSGQMALGRAMEAATADGDIISVLLLGGNALPWS